METKTVIAATTFYANVIGSYKPKRFAVFSIKRDPKKRALAQKVRLFPQILLCSWLCMD
jgi:hypothetical protein